MSKKYHAQDTSGALMPVESKIIAGLLLDGLSPKVIKTKVTDENLLQKSSRKTVTTSAWLILNRLAPQSQHLLRLIVEGDQELRLQALLVTALEHSPLLTDLFKVTIRKWHALDKTINKQDWDRLIEDIILQEPTVGNWTENTNGKLRQVMFKIMTEAKLLTTDKPKKIRPLLLRTELQRCLLEDDQEALVKLLEKLS